MADRIDPATLDLKENLVGINRVSKTVKGGRIARFTTAVFDVQPLGGGEIAETPPKSDPRYYFRPWKTILARTVADGGRSYYVEGEHRQTLPHLARRVWELDRG